MLAEPDVVGLLADDDAHVVLQTVRSARQRVTGGRAREKRVDARLLVWIQRVSRMLARTGMFAKPPLRSSSTRSGTSAIS